VSEAERNQLTTRLNDAYTEGKLDADDYHARLDRLYAAQKLGELVPVVEGLPPLRTYSNPVGVESGGGEPGTLAPARSGTGLTLVTGGMLLAALVVLVILLVIVL